MPFKTRYVFVVSMDVTPDREDLFNEVYDHEHVPYLMKVPGVVAVTRGRKAPASLAIGGEMKAVGEGEPTFIAFYEVESPAVLATDAWAEAVERGRWPTEVRAHTRNRHHVMHEVTASW
jgi:hypothetical protein